MRRKAGVLIFLALGVACDGAPGAPTPPGPGPGGPPVLQLSLRVVSALQNQVGIPQVTVMLPDGVQQLTDRTGGALINLAAAGTVALRLLHPDFVPRDTLVHVPGDGPVTLSLIPSSHDLVSFEEFAPRANGLQRWTRNPRMVVLTHAVDFAGAAAGFRDFPVVDRSFSQAQLDCIVGGMTAALEEMSGGHLSWEAVEFVHVEPGTRIRVDDTPEGTILVLPAVSLGAGGRGTGYAGADPFVLTRGAVFFEAILNYCVVSALYRHELGHALGYLHVTGRPSVMAPGSGALQEFDRNSIAIVFQRPPGSRLPDRDSSIPGVNIAAGPQRSPASRCGDQRESGRGYSSGIATTSAVRAPYRASIAASASSRASEGNAFMSASLIFERAVRRGSQGLFACDIHSMSDDHSGGGVRDQPAPAGAC